MTENLIENKCAICPQLPIWNNKPLVLVLDHVNGISNDNRLENLRLLCPNCNSQTETFAGKRKKYSVSKSVIKIEKSRPNQRKITIPDDLFLKVLSEEFNGNKSDMAKKLNVSETAIRKRKNKILNM